MSQLSTSHKKSVISNNVNDDFEKIPSYVSNRNEAFEKIIYQTSSVKHLMRELRQIAILMYKIMSIQMSHSLWTIYLKSGMGTLKSDQSHTIKVWPVEVKSLVMKQATNEDEACLTYVNNYLHHLNDKMKQYQTELNTKKSHIHVDTQMIEMFVQQELESHRIEIEHKIALVQYNYNDYVLELEYLQHNPSKHQKQIAKRLCHAKYEQEITKEEFNLVKQQISCHNSSQTFPTHVNLLNSINDATIRQQQQLYNQYTQIIQQSKDEMMIVYITSVEAQMMYYHKQFNDELKRLWQEQRSVPINQKLTKAMLDLIEQHYNNISERVKLVYKFKAQRLH